MQFLKTLFWAIFAVVLFWFGWANWDPVTVKLWAGLEADIKLPLLVAIAFLLGFVPTWLNYRARMWSLQRRLDTTAQAHVVSHPAPARPAAPTANTPSDRAATDAKAWPAQ